MAVADIAVLQGQMTEAQQEVTRCESHYGKQSLEYKRALKEFARAWFVLRMSREKSEFIRDLI
jgi:pterin-4a-carbinolamine dehydratase